MAQWINVLIVKEANFQLGWRQVSDRRMKSLAVIDSFDEMTDSLFGFGHILILEHINFFVFERSIKRSA
jgi:hypothetical protein